MKKAMRIAVVTLCFMMFASLIVYVGGYEPAQEVALASRAVQQGNETVLEAYAILVIIIAIVISSVAYVFLRDPHKKEKKPNEDSQNDKKN